MRKITKLIGFACLCTAAFAAPSIDKVQNNYSWTLPGMPSYGIAQGSIFAIIGTGLGPTTLTQASGFPLQTSLAGVSVQVTVGGTTKNVPLYYVSDKATAGVLPSDTPTGAGTITVTNNGASGSGNITVVQRAFGMLTVNGAGSGTVAAQNFTINSQTLPLPNVSGGAANAGDTIILWGTGMGPWVGHDTNAGTTEYQDMKDASGVQVFIGGMPATVAYAGRAFYPGLDQINTTVPTGLTGCYNAVVVQIGSYISNVGTLPVAQSGRTCQDSTTGQTGDQIAALNGKTTFNFGTVGLSKGVNLGMTGTETTSETGTAAFERVTPAQFNAFPQLAQPSANNCTVWSFGVDASGNPVIPSFTPLDAGTITISSPAGGTQTITRNSDGTYKTANLGTGSYFPANGGTVTVSGAGGADIGSFTASINVPSGFTWTNRAAAATVNRANGQEIDWTGGAAGTFVTMTGTSIAATQTGQFTGIAGFTCIAPAEANKFTIPSWVLLSLPPSPSLAGFSLPGSLSVADYGAPVSFTATGLDLGFVDFFASSSRTVTYQ